MEIITKNDLPSALQSHELVEVMLAGANAKALRVAPCLADSPSREALAEARLVLLGAVKRWVEAGSGAFQQQTAGPFSVSTDTRQRTGFALWPSEITALQDVCAGEGGDGGAFTVDMTGAPFMSNPLAGAVVNTAECGPTPIGSWSEEAVR